MATVYCDYSRDRIGWLFGLSGPQVAILSVGLFLALVAFSAKQWGPFLGLATGWALLFVLVIVPIRGRSATGWLAASAAHAVGVVFRWTPWRSRAALGQAGDLGVPDLPGVLHGIRVHDGPPQGPSLARVAVVQDTANRVWAVTAAITHPGLALADADERTRQGRGLTDLLNACARTELISEVIFVVRSVPDDGAERDQWLTRHLRGDAPPLARTVNEQLSRVLSQAAVRTETFVTIVAPEARPAKEAKEFGRGVDARARAILMLAGEVETHLRGGLRVTEVEWLTSPRLAAAVRTGFAPGDRAGIIEALAARETERGVNADVPWAQAGPSGADAVVRHYSHDAWNSISATLKLPARGAVVGALAPVLVPTEPGERRSLMAAFPILAASAADRQAANAEWADDMGETLRAKAGVKTRAREQQAAARTRGLDVKLVQIDAQGTRGRRFSLPQIGRERAGEDVVGVLQRHDDLGCRRLVESGVIALAQALVNRERESFGVERELRVDARLVSARVLAMPGFVEVDGDQTVNGITMRRVADALVAQAGREALAAQDRREQVRLCVAEPDPLVKHLRSGQRDARIPDVVGVGDIVPDPLEGGPGEGDLARVVAAQLPAKGDYFGVIGFHHWVWVDILARCLGIEMRSPVKFSIDPVGAASLAVLHGRSLRRVRWAFGQTGLT